MGERKAGMGQTGGPFLHDLLGCLDESQKIIPVAPLREGGRGLASGGCLPSP